MPSRTRTARKRARTTRCTAHQISNATAANAHSAATGTVDGSRSGRRKIWSMHRAGRPGDARAFYHVRHRAASARAPERAGGDLTAGGAGG